MSSQKEGIVNHKQPKRTNRTQARPLSDAELDRLWEEVRAADEADAGEEADLPEGVPLPEAPDSVVAIFLQRRGGAR
jgi:hypothetical protein